MSKIQSFTQELQCHQCLQQYINGFSSHTAIIVFCRIVGCATNILQLTK